MWKLHAFKPKGYSQSRQEFLINIRAFTRTTGHKIYLQEGNLELIASPTKGDDDVIITPLSYLW
jgi:hypothetical protein